MGRTHRPQQEVRGGTPDYLRVVRQGKSVDENMNVVEPPELLYDQRHGWVPPPAIGQAATAPSSALAGATAGRPTPNAQQIAMLKQAAANPSQRDQIVRFFEDKFGQGSAAQYLR